MDSRVASAPAPCRRRLRLRRRRACLRRLRRSFAASASSRRRSASRRHLVVSRSSSARARSRSRAFEPSRAAARLRLTARNSSRRDVSRSRVRDLTSSDLRPRCRSPPPNAPPPPPPPPRVVRRPPRASPPPPRARLPPPARLVRRAPLRLRRARARASCRRDPGSGAFAARAQTLVRRSPRLSPPPPPPPPPRDARASPRVPSPPPPRAVRRLPRARRPPSPPLLVDATRRVALQPPPPRGSALLLRLGARRARRRGSDLLLHLVHALGGGGGGVFSRLELFEDLGEFGVGSIGARALAAEVVGDARGLAAGLGGGGELDGARHRELGLGGGGGSWRRRARRRTRRRRARRRRARGLGLLGARESSSPLSLDPLTLLHRAGQLGAVRLSLLLRGAGGGVVVAHRVGRDRTRWAARGRVCDGGGGRAREFQPEVVTVGSSIVERRLGHITSQRAPMPILSASSAVARLARELRRFGRRLGARHLHARRPSRPALPAGRAPTTIVASLS